jgi:peroxiredoxin
MFALRKFALALTVIGTLAGISSLAHAQLVVGDPAPDYSFTDVNGTAHKLSDYKGKLIVLEWTNPGCPFVQKHYSEGDMQKLQATFTESPNILWFAINSSAAGKQGYAKDNTEGQAFAKDAKFAGTAYVRDPEGAFGQLYGAKTTPHMFIIDKDGKLAYQGAIDSNPSANQADIASAQNYVKDALIALRAGQKPKTLNSQPYGCGVKYADPAK